jgi:MtaA/CmuA family methyltransferase
MNSLQRFQAAISGQPADRPPVIPILHVAAAELIGATIGQLSTSPQVMADVGIAAYRHYGLDGLQLTLGVAAEASALGATILQPENSLPKVTKPSIHEPGDLSKLRVPDPWRDGLLPITLQATQIAARAVGAETCIISTIRGPMNIAGQIRGVQELMFDLIDRPDYADELLAFCTEVSLSYGKAIAASGAHVIAIGEALASPAFISPNYYRRLLHKLHGQLIAGLHAASSALTLLHICGDTRPILADIASTGVDIIDIDWQVSVKAARERVGNRVTLRGNLDPVEALYTGNPERVRELARIALAEAKEAGRFILSSGCDIPPGTPRANIQALAEAVRE